MVISENKKLHLLGRASSLAIKKVLPNSGPRKNCEWFFVDYAPNSFNLHETFDIFICDGNNGSNWNHEYKIKLLKVIDEFGKEHDSILKGYKTVCRFEFSPHIPASVKKMPVIAGWDITDAGISLMQHSSIDLLSSDKNCNEMHRLLVTMILEKIRSTNATEFSEEQFGSFISGSLSGNISLRKNLIYQLISDGLLEKEGNNKLVLVAA